MDIRLSRRRVGIREGMERRVLWRGGYEDVFQVGDILVCLISLPMTTLMLDWVFLQ